MLSANMLFQSHSCLMCRSIQHSEISTVWIDVKDQTKIFAHKRNVRLYDVMLLKKFMKCLKINYLRNVQQKFFSCCLLSHEMSWTNSVIIFCYQKFYPTAFRWNRSLYNIWSWILCNKITFTFCFAANSYSRNMPNFEWN